MKDRLRIGLLLAVVVLIYGNILPNQFVLDDELYITRNAQVIEPSLHALFTPNIVTMVFRPLTFATLALNWAISGPNPFAYHLLNIFLHAATVWLLYILLREFLGESPESQNIAFVACLLYAVHPIHTEAVAWAMGRAELLAAGFLFAAWILHLRDRPIASLSCFALALLSKESAVAFFPLVILGDFAIGRWKPRVRYALAGGLTAAYLGFLWKVQGGRFGQGQINVIDNPLASLPAGWRILNAMRVAWKYIGLQIYPKLLSCDYSFNGIIMYRDWRHTLPAAIAAAGIVAAWIWAIKKRHVAGVLAGGIYFAGFATTANILMPTGTIMGERLAYLPSAGFCLLVALGWNWLRQKQNNAAWAILATLVLLFSVRTAARNRDWKDALSLYSSSARAVPGSAKIHANLGNAYLLSNQLDLAEKEFQTSLRIYPYFPNTLSDYSTLETQRGHYQDALDKMRMAISMSGRNDLDYDAMVVKYSALLMKTKHFDEAKENLDREISQSPQYAPAWSARAVLHMGQGEYKEARSDAQTALQIDRNDFIGIGVLMRLDAHPSAASKN